MKIHQTLLDKLARTKKQYEKVTAFAKLLPMFEKQIIEGELTPERYCKLSDRHGKLYCAWGINWYTNTPTNYPKEEHSEVGFVNVYINCHSLFGDQCYTFGHIELGKILSDIKVHFFDSSNTAFYFLPEEAEDGLNKLEAWSVETHSKCDAYLKQKRKAELERQLKELS